jgi:hypothetical protein
LLQGQALIPETEALLISNEDNQSIEQHGGFKQGASQYIVEMELVEFKFNAYLTIIPP